jgi:malate synthase
MGRRFFLCPVHSSEFLERPAFQDFLRRIEAGFGARWEALLLARAERLAAPHPARQAIRAGQWQVAPLPAPLQKRYVEITGPADPKMIVNALNSRADGFMADLEDAFTPHPAKLLTAYEALYNAVRGQLQHTTEGKTYEQDPTSPTFLHVRPRGLHLVEKRLLPRLFSGAFLDAAVYLFYNAEALLERGRFPALYLAKLEHADEARLWQEFLTFCEGYLGLPLGTIRVTVLIETLGAALQTEEILYELRDRITALNAGRWDYLFSIVKHLLCTRGPLLPERHLLTMKEPFLEAYALEIVRSAHRRGALAIGGMSAFIPSRKDPALNEKALQAVKVDKELEIERGFDGAWVAHPDLVPVIQETFANAFQGAPNQLHRIPKEVSAEQITAFPALGERPLSSEALYRLIEVALLYLESWLQGQGAAAIHHLMEDAATAEIARTQLFQWLKATPPPRTEDGQEVSVFLYESFIRQAQKAHSQLSSQAVRLLQDLLYAPDLIPFFTSYAYERYLA